jgi:hypothetical protein
MSPVKGQVNDQDSENNSRIDINFDEPGPSEISKHKGDLLWRVEKPPDNPLERMIWRVEGQLGESLLGRVFRSVFGNGFRNSDRENRDRKSSGFWISFAELQRIHLRKLQCKLVQNVIDMRFPSLPTELEPVGWELNLKEYSK